jgi:hypothetical protein
MAACIDPGSEDTRGHGTTGMASLKQQVEELPRTAPRRTM